MSVPASPVWTTVPVKMASTVTAVTAFQASPGNTVKPVIILLLKSHDIAMIWKHFLHYWNFVRGIPPVTDGSPSEMANWNVDVVNSNKLLNKQWCFGWFQTTKRSCDSIAKNPCSIWHPSSDKVKLRAYRRRFKRNRYFFSHKMFNRLRPIQNDRRFPDDIFKCIFLKENAWISIKI